MLDDISLAGSVLIVSTGCLIVRVVDHKSSAKEAKASKSASTSEQEAPFSIHSHNEHITPSPFGKTPKSARDPTNTSPARPGTSASNTASKDGQSVSDETKKSPTSKHPKVPGKPKIFHTVLHPTPRSHQAEVTLLALKPDLRARKPSAPQANGRAGAGSASLVPPTPTENKFKRPKLIKNEEELAQVEANMIKITAPSLFLDPVGSFAEAQALLAQLQDPLHTALPPKSKTRKRTVAELEADEAFKAEEERFLLIMDESRSGPAGNKVVVDSQTGGAAFEPDFSRFKTLDNIKHQQEEKAKLEHEKKILEKQQQQEQADRERALLQQQQAKQAAQKAEEERQREEQMKRQRELAAARQAQISAAQQNQKAPVVTAGPTSQFMIQQMSQASHSSPVVRTLTPHVSSPMINNGAGPQAIPMSIGNSAQGQGSPHPRPASSLQHGPPGMLAHPMAPSRSQQGPSRNGTPQMQHGTPSMVQATPVIRNATPAQRMPNGSPNAPSMTQTPIMNHNVMSTPQMNHVGIPPQQQPLLQQQQQRLLQQQQQQRQQQQQQQQAMLAQQLAQVNTGQLTPQQLAQLQRNIQAGQASMQQQQQHHMQQQQVQGQNQHGMDHAAYQASLRQVQQSQLQQLQQRQLSQQQGNPQMQQAGVNQVALQQQQMIQQAQQQQRMGNANAMGQAMSHMAQQLMAQAKQQAITRWTQQYGDMGAVPPQLQRAWKEQTEAKIRQMVMQKFGQGQQNHQQQQQHQAHAQLQQQQMLQMQAIQQQAANMQRVQGQHHG